MGKMDAPEIPFMGGVGIPESTTPEELAGWVEEQDKIPLLLALSLYNIPRQSLGSYILIPNTIHERYAAWFDSSSGICIVGCRGTSPTKSYGGLDLQDDKVRITFIFFLN
tara:strand:+ start:167 stop:496 length:330 start_codon:yes stop_codon:yes gene_type:complete